MRVAELLIKSAQSRLPFQVIRPEIFHHSKAFGKVAGLRYLFAALLLLFSFLYLIELVLYILLFNFPLGDSVEIIISSLLQNFHISWTRPEVHVLDQFTFSVRSFPAKFRSTSGIGQ